MQAAHRQRMGWSGQPCLPCGTVPMKEFGVLKGLASGGSAAQVERPAEVCSFTRRHQAGPGSVRVPTR